MLHTAMNPTIMANNVFVMLMMREQTYSQQELALNVLIHVMKASYCRS